MLLLLLNGFHRYVFALVPVDLTAGGGVKFREENFLLNFSERLQTHPSQSMISGPSNEKGSDASGSDFILYTLVRTALLK